MKTNTHRTDQYDHLQAAYERAQEHALVCGQPTMEELTARIKTKPIPDIPGMTDILVAVAARMVRRRRSTGNG